MSIYKLRKGGAYGRAIGMLVSGPQFAKKRYWQSPSSGLSFKTSAFGRQVVKARLQKSERGIKKSKVKGGYIIENYGMWPDMVDALNRLAAKENAVQIGLFSDTSSYAVTERGTKNEFGMEVPQRSFIGMTFDRKQDDIRERFELGKMPLLLGKVKPKDFLTQEGEKFKNDIMEFIYGDFWGRNRPNTPSTIRKKGSDTPLIDTEEMVLSLDYKVVKER